MPKKVTKKAAVKKVDKTADNRTDELIGAMSEVVKAVKDLSGRVSDIENTKDVREATGVPVEDTRLDVPEDRGIVVDDAVVTDKDNTCPVPTEYRDLVDDILNKSFGIEVTASPSVPTFEFTVIVPEEYSNVPKDEKDQVQEDRRSKMITYAVGTAGVKEWVDKVYNNFSEEIKSKITQDRLTRL